MIRRAMFGEQSEQGRPWLGDLTHTFKPAGCLTACEQMTAWKKPLRRAMRAAANWLLQYTASSGDTPAGDATGSANRDFSVILA